MSFFDVISLQTDIFAAKCQYNLPNLAMFAMLIETVGEVNQDICIKSKTKTKMTKRV